MNGKQEDLFMSREYNVAKTMTSNYSSVIGKKEPLPHPQNCKTECPYGYGRAFCFPCMAMEGYGNDNPGANAHVR